MADSMRRGAGGIPKPTSRNAWCPAGCDGTGKISHECPYIRSQQIRSGRDGEPSELWSRWALVDGLPPSQHRAALDFSQTVDCLINPWCQVLLPEYY